MASTKAGTTDLGAVPFAKLIELHSRIWRPADGPQGDVILDPGLRIPHQPNLGY
jgi:hypothetical protein